MNKKKETTANVLLRVQLATTLILRSLSILIATGTAGNCRPAEYHGLGVNSTKLRGMSNKRMPTFFQVSNSQESPLAERARHVSL